MLLKKNVKKASPLLSKILIETSFNKKKAYVVLKFSKERNSSLVTINFLAMQCESNWVYTSCFYVSYNLFVEKDMEKSSA